jgi:hypothetical protein
MTGKALGGGQMHWPTETWIAVAIGVGLGFAIVEKLTRIIELLEMINRQIFKFLNPSSDDW